MYIYLDIILARIYNIYLTSLIHFIACKAPNVDCVAHDTDVRICVPKLLTCDGEWQCKDGSDEKDCGNQECDVGKFSCLDGLGCIEGAKKCNGAEDCGDGSDEMVCGRKIYKSIIYILILLTLIKCLGNVTL